MGEKRDALIKKIGRKDRDWKDYEGSQNIRNAYELAINTNKALNLYDKRLKDSGYRAKLKALKNAVRTIQAIVKDLENAKSVVKSAVDETISYIRNAAGGETLLKKEYFKLNDDNYVFDKIPEIDPNDISWEELAKLTKNERSKATQRSNSFKLINKLVNEFSRKEAEWIKEKDKKLSKVEKKENKDKKKERRLKSKIEIELERKLFKLKQLLLKAKTDKELDKLKKELSKLKNKLDKSKEQLGEGGTKKFNEKIIELEKEIDESKKK